MNRRLQQFLSVENITQSQLADNLGVARASVSHILSGRNKPGFEFIESMARHYPALNLDWFVTGKGRMFKDAYRDEASISESLPAPEEEFSAPETVPETLFSENNPPVTSQNTNFEAAAPQRSIERIVVFYTDGTFQELK